MKTFSVVTFCLLVVLYCTLMPKARDWANEQSYPLRSSIDIEEQLYDGAKAHAHLLNFVTPREYGMPEWHKACSYFVDALTTKHHPTLKMDVESITGSGVQAFRTGFYSYSDMKAIVVTLYNPELNPNRDNILLMSAHFDGHYNSSGTSDDLSGVMVMIEAANIMATRPEYVGANAVSFAFLGSEESGLEGSHMLIHDDMITRVKGVINIEAMGGGGRPNVCSVSPGAMSIIRHLDGVTPFTSVAGHGLYSDLFLGGLIQSSTDTQNYRAAGIPSVDLVHLNNTHIYHTHQDDPDHVTPADLAAVGVTLLKAARTHATRTVFPTSGGAIAYDSAFGVFVALPLAAVDRLACAVLAIHGCSLLVGFFRSGPRAGLKSLLALTVATLGATLPIIVACLLLGTQTIPLLWYRNATGTTLAALVAALAGTLTVAPLTKKLWDGADMLTITGASGAILGGIALAAARYGMASALIGLGPSLAIAIAAIVYIVPAPIIFRSPLPAAVISGIVLSFFHHISIDLLTTLDVIGLYDEGSDRLVYAIAGLVTIIGLLPALPAVARVRWPLLLVPALAVLTFWFLYPDDGALGFSDARPSIVVVGHHDSIEGSTVDSTVQLCSVRPLDIGRVYSPLLTTAGLDHVPCTGNLIMGTSPRACLCLPAADRSTLVPGVVHSTRTSPTTAAWTVDMTNTTAVNGRWVTVVTSDVAGTLRCPTLDRTWARDVAPGEPVEFFHQGLATHAPVNFTLESESDSTVTVVLTTRTAIIPADVDALLGAIPAWVRPFGKSAALGPDAISEKYVV